MKIYNFDQNTVEWSAARLGKFTASMFSDIFAAKTTQSYQHAIYRVAFERLAGVPIETYSNAAMERGHKLEPYARETYEEEQFQFVQQVGFCELNDWVG